MSISQVAQRAWSLYTGGKGFDQVLNKVKILTAGDGSCTAEMQVAEEHTNISGTLHGGLTSTIVDIISGVALSTHKDAPSVGVSVDLHLTFLNAAPLGEQIFIEAKTNKAGKTLAFCDVLITNKLTGVIVAKGTHTKYVAVRNK